MYPVLLKIGSFTLHTYGVLLAIGFLLAVLVALKEARRVNIDPNIVMDLAFYILISALIGSRLFYVLTNWDEFRDEPISIFLFWRGGLVFYGGLIFAFIVGFWYVKKKRLKFTPLADLVAPSIPLGQAIGRLGCFSAGCCYGKPAEIPWAVTFRDPQTLAPRGIPIHPTQLYESLATFSIFLILIIMRRRDHFQGKLFWYYLLFYATARFIIEFFRGDPRGWVIPQILSPAQALSILAAAFALFMLSRKQAPSARTKI
ncbi:MAG: prolipoprotein diacylglyceryl transferase [Thermodesulfobacteriota bacterium]